MRLAERLTAKTFIKGIVTLVEEGPKVFVKKLKARLRPQIDYQKWKEEQSPSFEELEIQKEMKWEKMPLFSVVVPIFQTPKKFLIAMLDSVVEQTYANWELCLYDGGDEKIEAGKETERIIREYQQKYSNIFYQRAAENLGISGNTNGALKMAGGDFIVFIDHDDTLTKNALYEVACAVRQQKEAEIIYSDEDKMDMDGKNFFMPHFKPDFNIDLLRSVNYICHLLVVKKTLIEKVGDFQREFDGAQDHDFILRCAEKAKGIYHIPKVLYHWRAHRDSTSENPESKRYAYEAGISAVKQHYQRLGISADVTYGVSLGIYRTIYQWEEKPLISILIPNKDHITDLEKCLKSIEKQRYTKYEIIIIENNSINPETFAYYERLKKERKNIQVVVWEQEKEFNYSKINNFGAKYAKGEYLLLLNNDTQMIENTCLEELLGFAMREDVGAVGARLFYEDNTIQHAGVVIGFGGIAGHAFINQRKEEYGYFARAICQQDYSAVTAACMMTKTEIFWKVNGFTAELSVAFNDIDYCLKVRELGKLVVYNPYAQLYHYESKSRGAENTPQKRKRFHQEIMIFYKRWKQILESGDPYYNPNLTLDRADFALKTRKEFLRANDYYINQVEKELEKEREI